MNLKNCFNSKKCLKKFSKKESVKLLNTFSEHEKCVQEKNEEPPKFIKSHFPPKQQGSKEKESSGGKFNALQKWLRGDDKLYGERKGSPGR